jgi:hypothetical protein
MRIAAARRPVRRNIPLNFDLRLYEQVRAFQWRFANERGFLWSFDRADRVADPAIGGIGRAAARHRDAADVTGLSVCGARDGSFRSRSARMDRARGDAGI